MTTTGLDIALLPERPRTACLDLQQSLSEILHENLIALWVYGAVTFEDRPVRLGDVDTHAVLVIGPDAETAKRIDNAHEANAEKNAIEWDSWYVLLNDARLSAPPRHAFREITDDAWALHRAHWLAGQYILLNGLHPSDIVVQPTWPELEDGLRDELEFIEEIIAQGRDDSGHAAFGLWNGCRILYSFETRDVVVSKRQGATWALQHLPPEWSEAIKAAGRVYDAAEKPEDEIVLRQNFVPFVDFVKARLDEV